MIELIAILGFYLLLGALATRWAYRKGKKLSTGSEKND